MTSVSLNEAFAAIDDDRPTLILAYTIKGYGLPIEGHPQNHSALLTAGQMRELAAHLGTDADQPWHRFPPDSAAGRLCAETARRLKRPAIAQQAPPECARKTSAARRPRWPPPRRRWAGPCST